jgi:cobalt-zinc-cadmium efflux system outer membrane protein
MLNVRYPRPAAVEAVPAHRNLRKERGTMTRSLWLCLALAVGAESRADEHASVLADAYASAWQRAVEAREAESRVALAAADARAARMWSADTPAVEFSNRSGARDNPAGVRESSLGIAWPIWLPGQRSAGLAAARADVEVAAAAERAARLRVAGQVRDALWEAQARGADVAGASKALEHWRALAADTDRRLAAGDVPRIEALAVRAEMLSAEAAAAEAETAAADAARAWTLLTGLPLPAAAPGFEAVADDAGDAVAEAAVAAHPDVRLAALQVERARAQVRFVRRTPMAAPELTVAVREDQMMPGDPAARSVVIGARVPFGGGARGDRLDAEAAGELAAATAAERLARERQSADLAAARRALASAQRQFEAEDARRALVVERLAFLERSYRAGETPLADLLRERAAAAVAEADAGRRRAALGLAHARLQQARGHLP